MWVTNVPRHRRRAILYRDHGASPGAGRACGPGHLEDTERQGDDDGVGVDHVPPLEHHRTPPAAVPHRRHLPRPPGRPGPPFLDPSRPCLPAALTTPTFSFVPLFSADLMRQNDAGPRANGAFGRFSTAGPSRAGPGRAGPDRTVEYSRYG
jgi:hypothetical protein